MSSRYFIDTNVFVYADQKQEDLKREQALRVLRHTLANSVISTQVVGEYIRAMRKLLDHGEQKQWPAARATRMAKLWPVVPLGSVHAETAIGIWESTPISYWDAQICAAALLAGCEAIITEDTRDPIAGIRYVNPFEPGFDPATLP